MEYTFTVRRSRSSVTQGIATVLLNGEPVVEFGDTIEIVKEGKTYYGDDIGGWASVVPDGDFVYDTLFHPHEDIFYFSKKVREILKPPTHD